MCGKKYYIISLLLILFITSVLTGCNSWFKNGGEKGVLRFQSGLEPVTLDPRKMKRVDELNIVQNIFSTLVMFGEDGRIVPCDAERWEVSLDGRSYVFHIRRDAKWSNGDPVTAYDYEYAWQSAMNSSFNSPSVAQFFYIKNAEAYNKGRASIDEVGVDAIDNLTLSVQLEKPTAYFLALLSQVFYAPVHKKTVEKNPDWENNVQTIITNGPFMVKQWEHNSKIIMVKNPKFWGASRIKLNQAEAILTENVEKIAKMFNDNELDLAVTIPDREVVTLKNEMKDADKQIKEYPDIGIVYYAFNTQKAPFNNQKVRQALNLAIDRKKLIDKVQSISGVPALAYVPYGFCEANDGNDDFRKLGGSFFKDNDVSGAKKVLSEAGYPDGQGFPKIKLIYAVSDWRKELAEAVIAMWKENLGIETELIALDNKKLTEYRRRGDFDITGSRWIKYYPDPMSFIDVFASGNNYNVTFWMNPDYDNYVSVAKGTIDKAVRMKAMHNAENILMQEMPIIPLYYTNNIYLVKPWVKGFVPYPEESGIDLWGVSVE